MKTFADWPEPISLRGRELKVHEFWWYMYSLVCDGPKGHMPKLTASSIVTFNKSFYHVKETYGFTSQDLKAAIYFAYITNPLGLVSICNYGNFDVFRTSLPIFIKWYNAVSDKTDIKAVFKAINEEGKKSSKRDIETDSMMEEFMVAMNGV